MKLLNFDRVLCLSPHPDDAEYSISGTVMKYSDTIFDILTMSVGGDFEGTDGDIRHQEVLNAWEVSGVSNVNIITTNKLKPKNNTQDKLVNIIENTYLEKYHDAIFVPKKIDSHFEHRLTNDLAAPLTRDKNITVVEYRTPSTLNEWSANMYVDISNIIDSKLNILAEFTSQQSKWYFKKELIKHFHADYQSFKKGYEYVEQFRVNQLYRL